METKLTIELCDYANPLHTSQLITLLNHYMLDPMGNFTPLNEEQQQKLVQSLSSNSKATILFVLYGSKFVGFTTLFELFSTFKVKPYFYIHDFVVHSDYRGKKIGAFLMDKVIQLARERNYCQLSLEVRIDNHPAMKLYRNCGFDACDPDMYCWTKPID